METRRRALESHTEDMGNLWTLAAIVLRRRNGGRTRNIGKDQGRRKGPSRRRSELDRSVIIAEEKDTGLGTVRNQRSLSGSSYVHLLKTSLKKIETT